MILQPLWVKFAKKNGERKYHMSSGWAFLNAKNFSKRGICLASLPSREPLFQLPNTRRNFINTSSTDNDLVVDWLS